MVALLARAAANDIVAYERIDEVMRNVKARFGVLTKKLRPGRCLCVCVQGSCRTRWPLPAQFAM